MVTSPDSIRMILLADHSIASATSAWVRPLRSRASRTAMRTRRRATAGRSPVDMRPSRPQLRPHLRAAPLSACPQMGVSRNTIRPAAYSHGGRYGSRHPVPFMALPFGFERSHQSPSDLPEPRPVTGAVQADQVVAVLGVELVHAWPDRPPCPEDHHLRITQLADPELAPLRYPNRDHLVGDQQLRTPEMRTHVSFPLSSRARGSTPARPLRARGGSARMGPEFLLRLPLARLKRRGKRHPAAAGSRSVPRPLSALRSA